MPALALSGTRRATARTGETKAAQDHKELSGKMDIKWIEKMKKGAMTVR